jgi:hypothetical protein
MLVSAAAGLLAQEGPSPNGPMDKNTDELEFTSKPSPTARVNTLYAYTAQAVSSDSTATIRYSGWFGGEDAMRMIPVHLFPIDSVTGITSWTPTAKGWYAIVLVATSNKGGREHQQFNVLVSGGEGTIQGRVTDTLGSGIPGIIVQALKTDIIPMGGDSEHEGGFFSYAAKSDSNGYYTIAHVEPGSYKLHAISTTPDYASQWYDGQTEAALANVVTVADSDVTTTDFVLRAGPAYHTKVTVSGRVADTLGAALNVPARIFFVRAGFALNANSSIDDFRQSFDDDRHGDFRLDRNSAFVFAATVDSLGNYTLRIPVGYYIALAKANGYATTFYQNQTDLTSANAIALQTDTSNISFTMVPLPPVTYGSISGVVVDSAKGIGVRARVIAFRDHWRQRDDYHVAESYTTDTDSTGGYSFNQLLPGTYIIFAIPVGNYAPAYYTTDTSSARWKHATTLAVNGNTFTGIDIYVRTLPAALQGYTGMKGLVKGNDENPVTGAFVYAVANGQVAGYGMTNSSGNYSINGLAPGTYSVVVDKTGFDEVAPQTTSVTYSNTTTSTGGVISVPVIQTVNFSVSGTTAVLAPVTNIVRDYTLQQNYPNPFNPSTTITFALPQAGRTTLKIFNILGQEVASLVDKVENSGPHQVVFNADKLSSGVYFYQLHSGSFVQSKKMILLK